MSGRIGNLNSKQEEALKKLRENVKDLGREFDNDYLLRWLRARSFDAKKSEKMLRDSLEWRKKMGADTILDWNPPEVLVKYYPGGHFGFDKEGYPIWIDLLGCADLKGLLYSARKTDIVKYKLLWTEKLYRIMEGRTKRSGGKVDGCALIFDMEGIGTKHLWRPVVSLFSEILCMFEANYPETLQYAFVINAPAIFPIAYNLLKHFLSEDTKKKIHVLGGCWKATLLEFIDQDQLPLHWGGSCKDPDGDPRCRSRVNVGGDIPVEYYLEKPQDIDLTNFSNVTVNRGSSVQLDFQITQLGSVLSWQFWTQDNDVGFGVYKRTSDQRQKAGDMVEVHPSERVNSHMVPEHGSVTCDAPGTYVVRFDNTYSWVRAKRVSYLIEVLESGEMKGIDIKDSNSFHSCLDFQNPEDC